ncbi:tryptophan synthase beta chain [Anaerolineaceae bacterium]|nr:tryptophan synthase beta chain [Anaerolineaceae bacterium]
MNKTNSHTLPDERGYFGAYGGRFVPETLIPALDELLAAYESARADAEFQDQLATLQATYVGRPTPLTHARRLSAQLGGAQIYLKREDLAHTGAHKINNAIGQALLAQRMGKQRIIAETGAGQHGVAAATAASIVGAGLPRLHGHGRYGPPTAKCVSDAAAGRRGAAGGSRQPNPEGCHQRSHPGLGNQRALHALHARVCPRPHPYPRMVRDFQSIIGIEARRQILEATGRLPDLCIACVGGGSNAIGLFHAFQDDAAVDLIGVEAGGSGIPAACMQRASLTPKLAGRACCTAHARL